MHKLLASEINSPQTSIHLHRGFKSTPHVSRLVSVHELQSFFINYINNNKKVLLYMYTYAHTHRCK